MIHFMKRLMIFIWGRDKMVNPELLKQMIRRVPKGACYVVSGIVGAIVGKKKSDVKEKKRQQKVLKKEMKREQKIRRKKNWK